MKNSYVALLPGLAVVALFLLWGAAQAGYPPVAWYPGALLVLGLLVVVVAFARPVLPPLAAPAAALFAAYAGWSFLSILWADVRGDAWDGANRTLLYVSVYTLFALLPWRAGTAAAVLGAFSLGTALVGGITLVRATAAADGSAYFIDGRFADPAGYANANAAMFLTALWPAVYLASRPEVNAVVRGALLAAAGVLLELALMTQSRAAQFALVVVLGLFLLLVPGRLRTVLSLVLVAAGAAAAADPLLEVYEAAKADVLHDRLRSALVAAAGSSAALLVIGTVWGLLDARVRIPAHRSAQAARALGAVAAAAAVGALAAVIAVGSPTGWVSDRWYEFTETGTPGFATGRLGVDLGSNRYDFWRVAMSQLAERPLTGIGADNFAVDYVRERRSREEPLYPHSLEVRVLSQTGIVGALLFGGFLALALAAAARVRRNPDPFARGVAGAALVAFGWWFVHGSVDWLWEFPGLGAPALAFLGLAGALGARRPEANAPAHAPRARATRVVLLASVAAVVGAAAFSYALPWLAARQVELAASSWRDDPRRAFARLETARGLNVLDERPDLIAGAIAARVGDLPRMRRAFERALDRNPHSWYAHLELAVVDALEGRRYAALGRLAAAERLNPREPAVELVRGRIREGRPISTRIVDRLFLERVEERTS